MEHERCNSPLMCTEQAPHCATPQPYLVPVSPTCSRRTQSSGVSPSTFTSKDLPFTFSLAIAWTTPPGKLTKLLYRTALGGSNLLCDRRCVQSMAQCLPSDFYGALFSVEDYCGACRIAARWSKEPIRTW